ncbi:MAG: efflux RND transporter periplasmic adaptor subunit [Planctomycetaceae bacterium]|nr:efflux RND transporter periplasmic adaptor subunit [Planctomycetaceae bacterium]
MKALNLLLVSGALGVAFVSGWFVRESLPAVSPDTRPNNSNADSAKLDVVAQGTLQPSSGLINIFGPPNQVVESILVSNGQAIRKDETELATFPLTKTLQRQASIAATQAAEAKRELAQRISLAEGQVDATRVAVSLAELQLEQAKLRDLLEIPERQLASAKEKLTRLEALAKDPKTEAYVAATAIDEQKLAIIEAEIQLSHAMKQNESAQKAATLELEAAKEAHDRAVATHQTLLTVQLQPTSADLAVSAAEAVAKEGRVMAPVDGQVVQVLARAGEAALHVPLMQVADLSKMECIAEVPDRLISQIHIGDSAKLQSSALPRELGGSVVEIIPVVGNRSLPDPNPLALVDRETVKVRIEINEADVPVAAKLLQLQVNVIFSSK